MFPFTDEELEVPVRNSIDKIRPVLVSDGGDIVLIRIENSVVYVQLTKACRGCSHSGSTVKNVIRRVLREDIHPDLEVVSVD